jgi:hypothetical protein
MGYHQAIEMCFHFFLGQYNSPCRWQMVDKRVKTIVKLPHFPEKPPHYHTKIAAPSLHGLLIKYLAEFYYE